LRTRTSLLTLGENMCLWEAKTKAMHVPLS
jgi:hypothetical protein